MARGHAVGTLALICALGAVALILGKMACSNWHIDAFTRQLHPALQNAGTPQRAEYLGGFIDDAGYARFDSISETYVRQAAAKMRLPELNAAQVADLEQGWAVRHWPDWFPRHFSGLLVFSNANSGGAPPQGQNAYWLVYNTTNQTLFYHWASF